MVQTFEPPQLPHFFKAEEMFPSLSVTELNYWTLAITEIVIRI